MDFAEVPIGLSMALLQNEEAVNACAVMTREEKKEILRKAHNVRLEAYCAMTRISSVKENDPFFLVYNRKWECYNE